jgi:molybdate transport system substrate-binding protein
MAALAVFAVCLGSVHAATVTVFAAASLKESLDEQARAFERESGHRVVASYAASSALARQIEAGAPAHLFISADADWMDAVERKGLLVPGSRTPLLANSLVLIAPADSTLSLRIAPRFALVDALGQGRLAIAQPDTVPAGKYAKAALTNLGVWAAVQERIAPAENVRAALALVALGEAPVGIVYLSDTRAEPRVRVLDRFAANAHPPIVYPAALLAGRTEPAAQTFLAYLRSSAARAVWAKHGFEPVRRGA